MVNIVDSYNRYINYLRISVTDRCNLQCIYCKPPSELNGLKHSDILTYEEILKIAKISLSIGIKKIRITGGEPLLRKGIISFISELSKLPGLEDLSITTNGILLKDYAADLFKAGVKRINVSLDSLNFNKYYKITGGDYLFRVLDGLEEAERVGFYPIKINVVVIKGINDDEIIDFALLTKGNPYHIRFIEFMPFNSNMEWKREYCISASEIFEIIDSFQRLQSMPFSPGETAKRYKFEDGLGEIGLISPVSDHFCSSCNRIRLTADGKIRTCLFSDNEIDIKFLMSQNIKNEDLERSLKIAIKKKPEKHHLNDGLFKKCTRGMSLIGG